MNSGLLLVSLECLLVNFGLLLVSLECLLVNLKILLVNLKILLVNLKILLVNLCVSFIFAAFTPAFLALLLAKQQYELPLYCFSLMFPFG
ncbi:hypothetical protein [Peribacillus aracenensis]|uniref:hypothetical protein n=1 Tax=Peribacillus aracenensis TaxID=2976708 RepID=UPI0021A86D7B|nr:hypothetical protein [Peribacillus sp. BBB004]